MKKPVSGVTLTLLLVGMLTLAFVIHPVEASETIYIRADGSVDPETALISTVDNITYVFTGNINASIVVERDSIVVDGASYILRGVVEDGFIPNEGIVLSGISNVTIKNVTIRGFWNGILLISSSDNIISGNNMTNYWYGISLDDSSNNTIYGNYITNNWGGISLDDSSNNTIYGNYITNNWNGVSLGGSDNSVSANHIISNNNHGIVQHGSNNIISGNDVTANNGYGILLAQCSNSIVSGNSLEYNEYAGIYLIGSSNNSITGNYLTSNKGGIYIYSSDNSIYHNIFVDNIEQVDAGPGLSNVWDNGFPSGGNYWSDYNGTDFYSGPYQNETGSDGIGDIPYIIDENNQDNYPLVLTHELAVSMRAPLIILFGRPTLLEATVYNRGLSNETNVKVELLINDSRVANVTIPELPRGSSHTLNYLWTPPVEGTYNVTFYASPVPDEATLANNVAMRDVSVLSTVPGTFISVEPPISTVAVGKIFTINITITGVTALFAWQICLYFDNATINFKEASYPPGHVFDNRDIMPVQPVVWANEKGTYVKYGCSLLGYYTPLFDGSGILCTLTFTGISSGFSSLNLIMKDTLLLDPDLEEMPFEVLDGLAVVEELEGDLNQDGVVDIKDIATAALAFGSFPDHPRWNPIADINGDDRVDIKDIALIARNFG